MQTGRESADLFTSNREPGLPARWSVEQGVNDPVLFFKEEPSFDTGTLGDLDGHALQGFHPFFDFMVGLLAVPDL